MTHALAQCVGVSCRRRAVPDPVHDGGAGRAGAAPCRRRGAGDGELLGSVGGPQPSALPAGSRRHDGGLPLTQYHPRGGDAQRHARHR